MIKLYEKKIEGLVTLSEGNCFENYYKKNTRHQKQKSAIRNNLRPDNIAQYLPCTVKVTRISPRQLDEHDNLRFSQKYIIDALAELLTGDTKAGRGDSDSRIKWEYGQKKGVPREYSVLIEIFKE